MIYFKDLNLEPIKVIAWKFNLGVALGGSLAIHGKSSNDYDLVFFPLKSSLSVDLLVFLTELKNHLNFRFVGAVDNRESGDAKLVIVSKDNLNRKVDLFFPFLSVDNLAILISDIKIIKRRVPKQYK
jgi:hypothetical protein